MSGGLQVGLRSCDRPPADLWPAGPRRWQRGAAHREGRGGLHVVGGWGSEPCDLQRTSTAGWKQICNTGNSALGLASP